MVYGGIISNEQGSGLGILNLVEVNKLKTKILIFLLTLLLATTLRLQHVLSKVSRPAKCNYGRYLSLSSALVLNYLTGYNFSYGIPPNSLMVARYDERMKAS